jgi:hypothetical protein
MMQLQLEFFPKTEIEILKDEILELKSTQTKLRKSNYAILGELKRLTQENASEIERLKSAICKQKDFLEPWLFK